MGGQFRRCGFIFLKAWRGSFSWIVGYLFYGIVGVPFCWALGVRGKASKGGSVHGGQIPACGEAKHFMVELPVG